MFYWSKRSDSFVHSYCGSLFVGHCTAVDLVEHYEEFVKLLDIDSKFLFQFGMDGPNVNLSFDCLRWIHPSSSWDHVQSIQFTLYFRRGLSSFFRDRFHQQHQTVKVLENFLTSCPVLGTVAKLE